MTKTKEHAEAVTDLIGDIRHYIVTDNKERTEAALRTLEIAVKHELPEGWLSRLVELGEVLTKKARLVDAKIKTTDVHEVADFIADLNYLLGFISSLDEREKVTHEPAPK